MRDYYTLCVKKVNPLTFDNVDWFSKLLHQLTRKKIMYTSQRLPARLQYDATLPCESRKSKNVTDFDNILNKLLKCSRGHFEDLI